jgi:lipid-A-disaccharide synthase
VVAGEHSGDEHAARMVSGLRRLRPGVRVAALGGPRLAAVGAQLLHDRTAVSVVGFAGALGNLPYFRRLFAETVRWIGEHGPSAVCFVDNSGVNLRLAKALRLRGLSAKGGGRVRTLYYISPQIWASRAERRFEMARDLDALAVIFPFEPACYADTGLPVEFVGHPFLAPDYRPPVQSDPAGPVLLLPGSRPGAVGRIFPSLLKAYLEFARRGHEREAVVLYPSDTIRAQLEAMPLPAAVKTRRSGETVGASAVLTSSGTMSMHCALAGIPGAIAYRADLFTYLVGRVMVRVPFLGIANILLGEAMYPEYIQGNATSEALGRELWTCIHEPERRARTKGQSDRLRTMLAGGGGGAEADWLLRNLP